MEATNQVQEKKAYGQQSSVIDVLSGNESLKFDISLSWDTIIYVAIAIMFLSTFTICMQRVILKK